MCIGARWPDRATNQKVARSSRAGRINNQKKTKQIEEKKGVRSLTPFRLVPRRVPLALFLLFFLARETEFLQRLGEHSRDLLIHFDVAFIRAPIMRRSTPPRIGSIVSFTSTPTWGRS
jgi:hypothetical protein